ncbi:MAG: hypothetical protein RML46_12955 [Anaerolineae bacterium]|nr:hypothetical protein [Anaerolineae bacterium]MDW8069803.1 hypothetical protein [Anaerolineae bacterium]
MASRAMPRLPRYGVVAVTQGLLQAEVVRTYLRSHGIPTVLLRYESAGRAIGITVDGLGEVQVLVPVRWERQARRLLRARGRTGRLLRGRRIPLARPRGRRRRPSAGRSR